MPALVPVLLLLPAGLRELGGAVLVTLVPVAGLTALPFEELFKPFTLVAVVLLTTVLPAVEALVPLLLLTDGAEFDEVLLLTELLTPDPPLRELPLLAESL